MLLVISFTFLSLASAENGGGETDYSVCERILFPCLTSLVEDYKRSHDKEYKHRLEYRFYRYQFIYWVHVYKFGETPSELVEKAFSSFNMVAVDSDDFIDMVRNRGMFFSDEGKFLGMRMTSSMRGKGEIRIKKSERREFDELTDEFIGFMRDLRAKRQNKVDEIEDRMRKFLDNE